MTKRLFTPLLLAFLVLPHAASASQTRWWKLSSQADFAGGDLKGVSVTSDGRLVPAPALKEIFDSGEAFVFAALLDKTRTLFLGTGNNGRVFRISPDGNGKEYAKLDEAGVFALALDSVGRLYAATSPDGKVYRFDDSGQPEVFFDPGDKYIWSLAMDGRNNLYVGTGPRGVIYKVDAQSEGSVFYETGENHVSTLSFDLDQNLLAGTSPGGLLLRITPQGRPSVLLDSPLSEVKGVALDRYGTVYAAALTTAQLPKLAQAPTEATPSSETKKAAQPSTVEAEGVKSGKGLEIYRISRKGAVETLYSSDSEAAFDLVIRGDGKLLAATGPKGRILSVHPDRFVNYLLETGEEQVTHLDEAGGRLLAVTSNLGKVFEIDGTRTHPASYESPVLDAGGSSGWGTILWKTTMPTPQVRLFTRSGNTAKPDRTWDDWSTAYSQADGSPITSLVGRYLQFKVEFPLEAAGGSITSPSQALEQVAVSYLQANRAPRLVSLTVHPAGTAFAPLPQSSSGGLSAGGPEGEHRRSLPRAIRELDGGQVSPAPRAIFVPGARSFSWEAKDPNDDALLYTVTIRRQGEEFWRPLRTDMELSYFSIDAAVLEDGVYDVKVSVTDRLSNPPDQAQVSEMVSKSFVVANAGPQLDLSPPQVSSRNAVIEFTAQARAAQLHQVEYQLDGSEWIVLLPEDGITDVGRERFRIELKALTAGDHALNVRIIDAVGNLVTRGLTLRIR